MKHMRVLKYIIAAEDDGRQIKRIIRGKMGVSHRVFSELKQRGGFMLDGTSVFANHIVHAGQEIRLELFDEEGGSPPMDDAPVNVIYEDDDIIVIDKDAPLACQSSEKQPERTLENRLMYRYRDQNFVFRPVNRLDKGTSGLMVAAKHAHAQNILQERLHSDCYVREYLAVICGCPEEMQGEINAPIRKAEGATVKREVSPDGKESITRYRVLRRGEEFSLVRLRLLTGRTHQIRVHMSYIGHPVAGDFLYGTEDERLKGRFALHSHYLSILHPMSGEMMEFTSPLPENLSELLR
jgi:23S rRNA pseudouridine1911/1915/1917 synthase